MNDMSEAPQENPLWARKGETVTCVKGHPICDIAHDLKFGIPRSSAHFTNWKQPEPDKADQVATLRCSLCRGVWIRGNTRDGYQFHFSDGWR